MVIARKISRYLKALEYKDKEDSESYETHIQTEEEARL